ncbi:MAG: hypothetical protein JSR17_07230 [Proteobacteria bacterium]|nr:hypothetical protein [Pseudomonadota bacterium]
MTYPQKQINRTINFIVDQLRYNYKQESIYLSGPQKKSLRKEIELALKPLSEKNRKKIEFHASNIDLAALFTSFNTQDIIFPDNMTIIIKRKGISIVWQGDVRTEIYNHQKEKRKTESQRDSELEEKLRLLTLDEVDDYSSSNSGEDEEDVFFERKPSTFVPLSDYIHQCARSHQKQQTTQVSISSKPALTNA